MKITITTPMTTVVDAEGVTHLRAEDSSGAFGIQRGHRDLLSALEISVVSWRAAGALHHCAVRGGVLRVSGGERLSIATREAIPGELETLEQRVLEEMRTRAEADAEARVEATRLRVEAIRRMLAFLRPPAGKGAP